MSAYFISGIDTDSGKSIATGLLARALGRRGKRVITQKLVQTGCRGISEDILTHRRIMGINPLDEDRNGLTCPHVFSYPASPHLAAEIDGATVDIESISHATRLLEARHDVVLVEGAGGVLVPLTCDYLTIDHVREAGYPLILVTSAKLGSINHTLLSLEACHHREVRVAALLYNHYPDASSPIARDTIAFFKTYIASHHPGCRWIEMPVVEGDNYPDLPVECLAP